MTSSLGITLCVALAVSTLHVRFSHGESHKLDNDWLVTDLIERESLRECDLGFITDQNIRPPISLGQRYNKSYC